MNLFTKHNSYNQLTEQYDILVMTEQEYLKNKDKLDNPKQIVLVNRAGGPKEPKMPQWFKQWSDEVYQKQQPKWFKKWTEEVYEKQQPKWFKQWTEQEFKPLVKRIDNLILKNNLKE